MGVTAFGSDPAQVVCPSFDLEIQHPDCRTQWTLTSYTPKDSTSLQVDLGSGSGVLVVPANDTVWTVSGPSGVYTFVVFPAA